MTELETVVLGLIEHCRVRLGLGWGKYPSGLRYAIGELLPLVDQDATSRNGDYIAEKVRDLDERLSR